MPSSQQSPYAFFQKIGLRVIILGGIQNLFNPHTQTPLASSSDPMAVEQALNMIIEEEQPGGLLEQSAEFLQQNPALGIPEHSAIETSHYLSAIANAFKTVRPDLFAEAETAEEATIQAIKAFVREGTLDAWTQIFLNLVDASDCTQEQKQNCKDFINSGAWFIRSFTQGNHALFYNIPEEELNRFDELDDWLRTNSCQNPQFQQMWQERASLIRRRKQAQDENITKASQWLNRCVSSMNPEINVFGGIQGYMNHIMQQKPQEDRTDLINNMEAYLSSKDILESNKLREFNELLNRKQWGKIFYQLVCDEQHPIAKTLWLLMQLDTIHIHPFEARSRLPGASLKGEMARNYGNKMHVSQPYSSWLQHRLMRAYADVIMDSLHTLADELYQLNVNSVAKELAVKIYQPQTVLQEEAKILEDLANFMLEQIYDATLQDQISVYQQLAVACTSQESLVNNAMRILESLKYFAKRLIQSRPGITEQMQDPAFVFAIGYNGAMFDCPSRYHSNRNEICFSYSESARSEGAYLFLLLLSRRAILPHHIRVHGLKQQGPEYCYAKYKVLIEKHLEFNVYHNDEEQGYLLSTGNPDSYLQTQRARLHYEALLDQLRSSQCYQELCQPLQQLVKEPEKWYCISTANFSFRNQDKVSFEIAQPITDAEKNAQNLAREMIFDLCCEQRLSEFHPELMPYLFDHWREKIALRYQSNPPIVLDISAVESYTDLPEQQQLYISKLIDNIALHVHFEILNIWKPAIQESFSAFCNSDDTIKKQKKRRDDLRKKIDSKQKLKVKLHEQYTQTQNLRKKEGIQTGIKNIQTELNDIENQLNMLPNVPSSPAELSVAQYKAFKIKFFIGRSTVQCAEPGLAKIVGHDRFLPVYIAKEMGKTIIHDPLDPNQRQLVVGNLYPQSVIPPCDKRCKPHATGHLYTGDMLDTMSADKLNQMRQSHGLSELPFRLSNMEVSLQQEGKNPQHLSESALVMPFSDPPVRGRANSLGTDVNELPVKTPATHSESHHNRSRSWSNTL